MSGPARRAPAAALAAVAALLAAVPVRAAEGGAADAGHSAFEVVGDSIPRPLGGAVGNAERGRAIVASRQTGLCLLCHPAPLPEPNLHGDLAPSLDGVGSRLTEGQLRLRVVDARRLEPSAVMPSYFRPGGGERVAAAFAGKPVLDAQQIEDVVTFLRTLR